MTEPQALIYVFHRGTTTSFARGAPGRSSFGGKTAHLFTGQPFGPGDLHHVGVLDPQDLAGDDLSGVSSIPLLHGLTFDGFDCSYCFAEAVIDVDFMYPASSAPDWPYPDYPATLPFVPLSACGCRRQTWKDFVEERLPGLNQVQTSDLVVAVPPPTSIGMSLWGDMGDSERTTLVFQCSIRDRRVRTYNVCT
jgi:hypothetical protein